jgi:catechol 2,3-dioxygenase-like lactoylglutathione lyase family enzyme
MQFNHLHFATSRLEATRDFYTGYFGFEPFTKLRDTVVLKGKAHFLLAMDPACEATEPNARLHFGFCVETADEVDALYGRMLADGIAFAQPLKAISPHARNFYCYDPSGNCVEVGWYRPLLSGHLVP